VARRKPDPVRRLANTNATYAIITSRSYHPGSVQVAMMDGSGQTINDNIDMLVWRSMATRAGGEVTSSQ
jgi:hypothetical protein